MQEIDFRAWLPPGETLKEKRRRVRKERIRGDAYLKRRLEESAHYYSIPLRVFHLQYLAKYFPKYHEIKEQMVKEEDMTVNLKTQHCLEMDSQGAIKSTSKALGQRLPKKFVRSTALASWRAQRFHPQIPEPQEGTSSKTSSTTAVESCTFKDFLDRMSDLKVKTEQREAQVRGASKSGSFFLLTPYQRSQHWTKLKETVLTPYEERLEDSKGIDKSLKQEAKKRHSVETHSKKGKVRFVKQPSVLLESESEECTDTDTEY